MKKIIKLNESDILKIVRKVVSEEEKKKDKKASLLWKIEKKLKGVSDEQLDYNMRNNLPWDWKGTKEGYYEKIEPSKRYTGSN